MIAEVPFAVVRASLTAKHFVKEATKRRDHEMYFLHVNGQKTNWFVKLSHGKKTMRIDEIRANARAPLKIAGEDLYYILSCKHGPEKTIELYQQFERREAELACPGCAQDTADGDFQDDRGRRWHTRCAASDLQRYPWNHDRTVCPACGSAAQARVVDAGQRPWHLECASAHLASVALL